MKLTKEMAIEYFNQKAPKKLREKGIVDVEGYSKGDESVYVINGVYIVRYIVPEAMNCLMRNQNYNPVLRGAKWPRKDVLRAIDALVNKGYSKTY